VLPLTSYIPTFYIPQMPREAAPRSRVGRVQAPKFAAWCFTDNNPTETFDPSQRPSIRCAIWQLERGETTGTLHHQGYIVFNKLLTLANVKHVLPRAHWEKRKGTHAEAWAYCMKPETRVEGPWTYGEGDQPEQGKRNDIEELHKDLIACKTMKEISQDHFPLFLRYSKGIYAYAALHSPERTWKTRVEIHWGVTGAGKSHYAKNHKGAYFKEQGNMAPWWDGYDKQEVVVLEEFYGWLQPSFCLRLFDDTPMTVPIKGGSVPFVAKLIIITSNQSWERWWADTVRYSRPAMARRIDFIKEYTQPYVPPPITREDSVASTHLFGEESPPPVLSVPSVDEMDEE